MNHAIYLLIVFFLYMNISLKLIIFNKIKPFEIS